MPAMALEWEGAVDGREGKLNTRSRGPFDRPTEEGGS